MRPSPVEIGDGHSARAGGQSQIALGRDVLEALALEVTEDVGTQDEVLPAVPVEIDPRPATSAREDASG